MGQIVIQLRREIFNISLNELLHFKKECCIPIIKLASLSVALTVQQLQPSIKNSLIHSKYKTIHHMIHLPEAIRRMSSCYNDFPDSSKSLHIRHTKVLYQPTNKVNYIHPIFKHNH